METAIGIWLIILGVAGIPNIGRFAQADNAIGIFVSVVVVAWTIFAGIYVLP